MDRSGFVAGHAPIDAVVLFLLAVEGSQEEQRSGGEEHVVRVQLDRIAIFEPLDDWRWFALGLAVQGYWVSFRDGDVAWVFRYSRGSELSCKENEKNCGFS